MSDTETARQCCDWMVAADRATKGIGIEVTVKTAGVAEASMVVTGRMLNGHKVCHGGFIFSLADTAFAYACNGYDNVSVAAAASIEFLRPVKEHDRLTAVASERYRGRRRGVYDVTVSNQDGEQVAEFRGRSHSTGKPMLGG